MKKLIFTRLTPIAYRVGNVFVPAIFDPDDGPELFWRKAKPTPEDALRYAERVLHFRKLRPTRPGGTWPRSPIPGGSKSSPP